LQHVFLFQQPIYNRQDALSSGNCTLITNAVVSHVNMDDAENKARGVTYVIAQRGSEGKSAESGDPLRAGIGIPRILLNSATREYPNGLANSSAR